MRGRAFKPWGRDRCCREKEVDKAAFLQTNVVDLKNDFLDPCDQKLGMNSEGIRSTLYWRELHFECLASLPD